jgi:hypothetical protein
MQVVRRVAQALAALALLAGCPASKAEWKVIAELDRVALSAWGAESGERFVVGGGLGNGAPGMMWVLKSGKWKAVELSSTDTLWWVFGFSASEVYAVGEHGALYRYDGEQAHRLSIPTTATLFGIWGTSPSDLWVVGGSPNGDAPNDVLLHFDGQTWTQAQLPRVFDVPFLKVWGSAADDVYVVGQVGVILHFDGTGWTHQPSGSTSVLVTVAGSSATDVYAVGGPPFALLHNDGTGWKSEEPPGIASGLGGVAFGANGDLFAVGLAGVKWRRPSGTKEWIDESEALPSNDLHGVWVAADGSAIAVGGNYVAANNLATPRKGVVAYFGSAPPPNIP